MHPLPSHLSHIPYEVRDVYVCVQHLHLHNVCQLSAGGMHCVAGKIQSS